MENQSGINPHDNLTLEESSLIIRSHVTDGLKLAHKHKLPLVIRDCIRSHHGNGPVRFFYNKFVLEHPEEKVPDSFFYQGTPSCFEGNSHSNDGRCGRSFFKEPQGRIRKKVSVNWWKRSSTNKITEGLFKDVPITFRDLERLKRVFKTKLVTIYHTRIEYPELPSFNQPPVTE